MFGALAWDSLLTDENGAYETGVFDIRRNVASPTLLAEAVRALANEGDWDHPGLAEPGGWRRSERVCTPGRRRIPS